MPEPTRPAGSPEAGLAARWMPTLLLPLAWLAVAALMAMSWRSDPFDAARVGTDAYGHNGEGALTTGLVLTAVEALVLLIALRPWSYTRTSWWRPLAVLMLALPWTILSGILTMHAGGVITIHLLWLLAVDLALILLTLVTVFARVASRDHPATAPPR